MKELLQKSLMTCEALAAFAGIICLAKIKDSRIKAFVAYLCFIIIAELVGWYVQHNYKNATSLLYSGIIIVEFLFPYWLIYSYSANKKLKTTAVYFGAFALAVNIFEVLFLRNEKFYFLSLSYLVFALFLLILTLWFLWEFIQSDKIIQAGRHLIFWLCIAWLIYYLGTYPLYAFYNYLYKIDKNSFNLYWKIQMYINMLMYILFCTGLLWTSLRYRHLSP